jgi:hemerythrin-like domain-containing protein
MTAALNPGQAFMLALRRDHAGLSRVLRIIDAQADRLPREPETAQPVLAEAMSYLLHYHHAFHHPREDRLFARIGSKDAALAQTLQDLTGEHQTGEQETAALAEDLANATPEQLHGKAANGLVGRINDYVRHTRTHMRHEEAVFYTRAEQVLDDQDWRAILNDEAPEDPQTDLTLMSTTYPHLAASLGLTTSHLGSSDPSPPVSRELRLQMLALADLYSGLMHDAVDLTRVNVNRLMAVRNPAGLVRAAGAISSDNLRFAGRCLTRPSRWAVNTSAGLVVAWLRESGEKSGEKSGKRGKGR